MNPEPTQPLWSMQWPADTPQALVRALADAAEPRRLKDGEWLYARGDTAEGLVGVVSGRIRNVLLQPDGQEMLFSVFSAGEWFGEISMFDEAPRPLHAIAVGASEVRIVPRARFRALLDAEPQWYGHFARVLCGKLRMAFDTLADMQSLPLSLRLVKRLLDLAKAYGEPVPQGLRIGLRLPQEELGRMLGASRQSINRELQALRAQQLIDIAQHRVTLLQPDALATLLRTV